MIFLNCLIIVIVFLSTCSTGAVILGKTAGLQRTNQTCQPGFYCNVDDSYERYCGGNNWYCDLGSTQPTQVSLGYYSVGGTELSRISQKKCEIGYYCVDGVRYTCPPGKIGNQIGLFTENCSGPCPKGLYCPYSGMTNGIPCVNESVYCPEGSIIPKQVSPGYYTISEDDGVRTEQRIAPKGWYAIRGILLPCQPGRYGDVEGLSNSSCSGECHAGFFCPSNSTSPREFYCGGEDRFCPAGSSAPTFVSIGYYTSTSLEPCGPGKWRNNSLSFDWSLHPVVLHSAIPTSIKPPLCSFCPEGTFKYQKGDSNDLCFRCPSFSASTVDRISCSCFRIEKGGRLKPLLFNATSRSCKTPDVSGTPKSSSHNNHILSETQITKTEQFLCEPGFFCENGTRFPCPKGYFGLKAGGNNVHCDGTCPPGFYCTEATIIPRPCGSVDLFCPEGSYSPRFVSEGSETYNNRTSLTKLSAGMPLSVLRDAERKCPLGRFCVGGVSYLCPGGTFGGQVGLSNERCSGECLPGYFCPSGSSSNMQHKCGNATVFCPPASAYPLKAKDGHYTVQLMDDNGLHQTAYKQILCEKGYFCRSGVKKQCPPGSYGWVNGASAEDDACKLCKEGYYCPSPQGSPSVGNTSQKPCGSSRVFCPKQSGEALIVDVGFYSVGGDSEMFRVAQEICPKGHYCIDGVIHKCSGGRYGDTQGLIDRY